MKFEIRPWGWMIKIVHGYRFWIKFIRVVGRTSRQRHNMRDEYHLCFYRVPKREIHRLHRGIYLEFAFGLPKEDDIERLSDDYGRDK